jgi:hypothetical protein
MGQNFRETTFGVTAFLNLSLMAGCCNAHLHGPLHCCSVLFGTRKTSLKPGVSTSEKQG